MHVISSYHRNRPTNTHTNPQTGPITIHCAAASAPVYCKKDYDKAETNRTWFTRLLRHPARKRIGPDSVFFECPEPERGRPNSKCDKVLVMSAVLRSERLVVGENRSISHNTRASVHCWLWTHVTEMRTDTSAVRVS